jgi:hypothetical protein
MSRRALLALVPLLPGLVSAAEFPTFERVVLDANVGKVCYAVSVADVNGDGKPDVVAVTENRVLWFEAPDWKPRTIVENATQLDNVCIDPHDVDGDGQVDFALGAGWLNGKNTGTIQWLSRGKTLDEPWSVHLIGEIPWTHRMRWADVLGSGTPQLVVSPLNKSGDDAGARLTAFSIPKNPRTDRWEQTLLDATLNKMHNHWHADVNRDDRIDTLTASEEGVKLFRRKEGGFEGRLLPKSQGAGEVKTGKLKNVVAGAGDRWFICTVEPMHGTDLAVYVEDHDAEEHVRREVVQTGLGRGHALWTADIDGDGHDEIVLGHSEPGTGDVKGPGIYVYDSNDDGTKWTKHVVDDGGIATEDLIATDLTGDGKVDIVAGGRETQNVVLYVNKGKHEAPSTKSETNPKSE